MFECCGPVWLMPTSSTKEEAGDGFGTRCPLSAVPMPAEQDIPVSSRTFGSTGLAL
jgi:hypothetical protein